MALINCKECGAEVSDKASSCPKCGYPINEDLVQRTSFKKNRKIRNVAISILLAIIVIMVGIIMIAESGNDTGTSGAIESQMPTATPKPEVIIEMTNDNFREYFDVIITCENMSTYNETLKTGGFRECDACFDMNITIKSKQPVACENVILSIEPNVGMSYEENKWCGQINDKVENIKLDSEGYFTTTKTINIKKIQLTLVWEIGSLSSIIKTYEQNIKIYDVSGKITVKK